MERNNSRWTRQFLSLFGFVLRLSMGLNTAHCQPQVELMLEQNPVQGGIINPGTGIHQFASNSQVALTAVPKDGYRFSHWLGDVSDTTSRTTHVLLTDSKAIVAIFEPLTLGGSDDEDRIYFTGGGGGAGNGAGGLMSTTSDFFMVGFSAPGGSSPQPLIDTVAVMPVPEPATIILLGLGGLTLSIKKRRKFTAENSIK